jgi:hypothetical protein
MAEPEPCFPLYFMNLTVLIKLINSRGMSTAPAKAPSNFELETKIRLIIKELLEATSNKYHTQ